MRHSKKQRRLEAPMDHSKLLEPWIDGLPPRAAFSVTFKLSYLSVLAHVQNPPAATSSVAKQMITVRSVPHAITSGFSVPHTPVGPGLKKYAPVKIANNELKNIKSAPCHHLDITLCSISCMLASRNRWCSHLSLCKHE